nr:restriction endonuclease subunit S [Tenuifilaceae bacterium]
EHWEVKRLKFLVKKSYSGGTPSTDKTDYWDGGIPWISSSDVKFDILKDTLREISHKGLMNSSANLAPKGTVVFVTRSGILQHTFPISILDREMAVNQDIKCLLFSCLIIPEYFQKLIQGNNAKVLVETRQQAATVESINMNAFFNLFIPIPPIQEQKEIVSHIETQTAKIATAISLIEQEIEKLKEYKSTLIDSAVTGKVKVC